MGYGDGFFDGDDDIEMAELREAAAIADAKRKRSQRLLAAGDRTGAAEACPHGSGYGLRGDAAKRANDPRCGEEGDRCDECFSVVRDLIRDPVVVFPCEPRPC